MKKEDINIVKYYYFTDPCNADEFYVSTNPIQYKNDFTDDEWEQFCCDYDDGLFNAQIFDGDEEHPFLIDGIWAILNNAPVEGKHNILQEDWVFDDEESAKRFAGNHYTVYRNDNGEEIYLFRLYTDDKTSFGSKLPLDDKENPQ